MNSGNEVGAGTHATLSEVRRERERQNEKWGEQNHPDGTSRWAGMGALLEADARKLLEEDPSYAAIFMEEVGEALQATSVEDLRAELVQVAAVAVAWIEAIDRRGSR